MKRKRVLALAMSLMMAISSIDLSCFALQVNASEDNVETVSSDSIVVTYDDEIVVDDEVDVTQTESDEDYSVADYSDEIEAGIEVASGDCSAVNSAVTWKVVTNTDVLDGDLQTYTVIIDGTGKMRDYSSATAIEWYSYKDSVTRVVIGDEVTYIDKDAVCNLINLKVLKIPVDYVYSERTFDNCRKIEKIIYTAGKTGIMPDVKNGSYANSYDKKPEYASNRSIKEVIFEEGCKNVANYAFYSDWYSVMPLEKVILPSSLTSIGACAFKGQSNLKDFALPENVETIGDWAFTDVFTVNGDVTELSQINWPANVTTVSAHCFEGCTGLKKIEISENITSLGMSAFGNCSSVKELKMPVDLNLNVRSFWGTSNIEKIIYTAGKTGIMPDVKNGSYTNSYDKKPEYASNRSIKEIVFEEGCTNVANYAFHADWYTVMPLEKVVLPSTVTSIGTCAFKGQSNLKDVVLPENVEIIGEWAFADVFTEKSEVTELSQINWPSKVTAVSAHCFNGCTSLEKIEIPETITSMGVNAFGSCSSVKELKMPVDLKLTAKSFSNTANIEKIIYTPGATGIMADVRNGSYDNSCDKRPEYASRGSIKEIVFEEGCLNVPNNAFYADWYTVMPLEKVVLPSTVTSIGAFAFKGQKNIRGFVLPKNVEIIGDWAFADVFAEESDVTELSQINWPAKVTAVSAHCFNGCTSLEKIEIPETITSMGVNAFGSCSSVKELKMPVDLKLTAKSFSNTTNIEKIIYTPGVTGIMADVRSGSYDNSCDKRPEYASNKSIKEIVFEEGCLNIPEYAYYSAYYGKMPINKVVLPEGMLSIGKRAFSGQSNISDIVLPDSINTIGEYAFESCFLEEGNITDLSQINWPASITEVSPRCFNGCTGLESLVIPDNITKVGTAAFYGCSNLSEIRFDGNPIIETNAFYGCLKDLVIYGCVGSYAEKYAKNNNIKFIERIAQENAVCGTKLSDIRIYDNNYEWLEPEYVVENSNADECDLSEDVTVYVVLKSDKDTVREIQINVNHNLTYSKPNGNEQHGTYCVGCDKWYDLEDCYGGKATCVSKAVCEVCGDSYGDIDKNNHVNELKHVEAVAASCEEDGNVEYYHCDDCGYDYADEDAVKILDNVVVKATGHNFDAGKVTKAPGCETAGIKTYTCTNTGCDKVYTEEIVALGHKEVKDDAVEASCEVAGKTEGSHCSICEKVIVAQREIAATGHSYDEGKITKEPTTQETGERTYTCTKCGATKVESIDKLEESPEVEDEIATNVIEISVKGKADIEAFAKQLLANTEYSNETIAGYSIISGDKKAVKVSKKGVLTAKKAGEVEIAVLKRINKKSFENLVVIKVIVKDTKFDEAKKTIRYIGDSIDLGKALINVPTKQKVKFLFASSKMSKYAELDETTGVVTAKANGKIKVTCLVGEDKNAAKINCTITIKTPQIKPTSNIKVKESKEKKISLNNVVASDDIEWTISDTSVLQFVGEATGNKVIVKGVTKGEAELTATVNGHKIAKIITVK